MPVNLQSTPITNNCGVGLTLQLAGNPVAGLAAGQASFMTLTFDEVLLANAVVPYPFTQIPNVGVQVVPGNVAVLEQNTAGVRLQYGVPGGVMQRVQFT